MFKGLKIPAWSLLICGVWSGSVSAQPKGSVSDGLDPSRSPEDAVKVAVVVQLVQFVAWPDAAWPTPGKPVVLCVLAKDEWVPLLEQSAQGESVRGHPIAVTRIGKPQEAHACQILVVGGRITQEWLDLWGTWPVLTVSGDGSSPARLAMVNLTIESGHARFKLNLELAVRAGIRFSSKLLQLAGAEARGAR
jgi:hypothetical protein